MNETLHDQVKQALLNAGYKAFGSSPQASNGFELWYTDDQVDVLHAEEGRTKQERIECLTSYQQALTQFNTEIVYPAVKVKRKR